MRQRPEGVDRRQLARREAQRVAVGAVQRLVAGVDEIDRDRSPRPWSCRRCPARRPPCEPCSRSSGTRAFRSCPRSISFPVSICVSLCSLNAAQASAMPSSTALRISGESASGSKVLPGADAELGEARHQRRLGRVRRAELQDEVQLVEECGRGAALHRRVSGLKKSIGGAAAGAGCAEELPTAAGPCSRPGSS